MDIVTIETVGLGHRSYLVHDGNSAAVIDPQRDIDRTFRALDEHALNLVAVLETHVHNDYVTGGLELSRRSGATYYLSGHESPAFEFFPMGDGDAVDIGAFQIRAVHTPGHTPTHLSYIASEEGRDAALFSGGCLLYGSVGRTDLISPEKTVELSRWQYRSARRLASLLDDDVQVCPTHGFGSYCSASDTTRSDTSTVGQQRRENTALVSEDESLFVRDLLRGLGPYPAYYAHMASINLSGPPDVDLSPPGSVDASELRRRIEADEWIIDLRTRTAFAREHIAGTINVELSADAATYIGWIIPWGTPVTLLADSTDEIAEAQRQLARIGIHRPSGQVASGLSGLGPVALRDRFDTSDFAGLRCALDERPDTVVIDVRRHAEWSAEHLDVALNIPLHELEQRLDEIPRREAWVHCASGYRASIAASLLARAGWEVVLVDDVFNRRAGKYFELHAGS